MIPTAKCVSCTSISHMLPELALHASFLWVIACSNPENHWTSFPSFTRHGCDKTLPVGFFKLGPATNRASRRPPQRTLPPHSLEPVASRETRQKRSGKEKLSWNSDQCERGYPSIMEISVVSLVFIIELAISKITQLTKNTHVITFLNNFYHGKDDCSYGSYLI